MNSPKLLSSQALSVLEPCASGSAARVSGQICCSWAHAEGSNPLGTCDLVHVFAMKHLLKSLRMSRGCSHLKRWLEAGCCCTSSTVPGTARARWPGSAKPAANPVVSARGARFHGVERRDAEVPLMLVAAQLPPLADLNRALHGGAGVVQRKPVWQRSDLSCMPKEEGKGTWCFCWAVLLARRWRVVSSEKLPL